MNSVRCLILNFGDPILDLMGLSLESLRARNEFKGHSKVVDTRNLKASEIEPIVEGFQPSFCLFANYDLFTWHSEGPQLEAYFKEKKIPLFSWYFEAPHFSGGFRHLERMLYGPYPSHVFFLTTDTAYLDFFRSRGMKAEYLPLAVDAKFLDFKASASMSAEFKNRTIYSGTPFLKGAPVRDDQKKMRDLHILALRQCLWSNAIQEHRELESKLELYEANTLSLLENFFESSWTNPDLYQQAKEKLCQDMLALLPAIFERLLPIYFCPRLDTTYSFYQLQSYLRRLTERGLQIYGTDDWKVTFPHLNQDTRRLSEVELYSAFQSSRLVFCLTKLTFKNFVHERAFHVLGVRGLPLLDYRKDLSLLFERDEILTYQSLEEAMDLIEFYQTNENSRNQIVEKGHQRVRREHTYLHRTRKLLDLVAATI